MQIKIEELEKVVCEAMENGYSVTLQINGEFYEIDLNESQKTQGQNGKER